MKFNGPKNEASKNLAGGLAYKQSPKSELITILLTSFVEDQYYRETDDTIKKIQELIDEINDPKFVAKMAIYARTKFGMRSITHVVAAEIAKKTSGLPWTRNFFDKIVYRPDDMLEILSYYFLTEKKLSNPIRDGFARALRRFDEYSLAKYRGEGKKIKLVDVVNLCHPKSTPALDKLINGELKSEDTWESELTKAGQQAETEAEKEQLKAEAWQSLIVEKKIGYFALLRNLRNIIQQSPDVLPDALKLLVDPRLIQKSLVLPFRFLTAIEQIEQVQIEGAKETLLALSEAIDISLMNVPVFEGETLVVLDTSASMNGRPIRIGSLFAAALLKTNQCDFMTFDNDARYVTINTKDSTSTIAKNIERDAHGGATNFHDIFIKTRKKYDRIIIFSDMQGWVGYDSPTKKFKKYKKKFDADPIVYSFDLQGYGTTQLPENNVYALAGFSDKIFDLMKFIENDKSAIFSEIEKIEL